MGSSSIFDFSTTIFAKRSKHISNIKQEHLPNSKSSMKKKTLEKFSFTELSEGVKFSDLADKMRPVCVEGLEDITGIVGRLEDVVIDSTEESNLSSKKFKKTGKPTDGALLYAHVALFIEGKASPFDTSYFKGQQILKLSRDDILPGILVACRFLYPGQCGQFLLPPHTMYREQGSPPFVPKSATILMVVQSSNWIDAGAPDRYDVLDNSLKIDFLSVQNIVENSNETAAFYFSKKKYKTSLKYYKKINDILNNLDNNSFSKEINSCKIRNFVNIAICYNFLDKPHLAMCHLDEASVLGNSKENCKYLYTRGKSHLLLGNLEEAFDFYLLALKMEPNNIQIGEEFSKLDNLIAKYKNETSSIVKNMFKFGLNNSTCDIQNEELTKNVTVFCEHLKTTPFTCFPLPPYILKEDEEKLQNIVKSIDGCKIISQKLLNGNIQKYFAIENHV